MADCQAHNLKVAGSSPAPATKFGCLAERFKALDLKSSGNESYP